MNEQQILTQYVNTIVATLIEQGVKHAVISPGSRSTPLAYALAHAEGVTTYRQVDERSAAFFALGVAKAQNEPTVLVCTSGTAAANYFPAIVEASYARVPLIILTADRPHELREVGAPQAINQINLYGQHVKWFVDFPIPDEHPQTLLHIEHHTARAVACSKTAPFGPVHVNIPFREPLVIDFEELPAPKISRYYPSEIVPAKPVIEQLQATIRATKKGVIVVGEQALNTDLTYLWALVRQLKWPVIVEALSNMRSNVPDDCGRYVISTYDAFLKHEDLRRKLNPQTVIRFGAQPVSKFFMQFIANSDVENYIVVDENPLFRDSIATATQFVHATVGQWLEQFDQSAIEQSYVQSWQRAQAIAVQQIIQYEQYTIDEGAFVQQLLREVDGVNIFASSSMPIRDIDTFMTPTDKDVQIVANRGANGIDGVVSTAFGYSCVSERETYILIGDLAMLHDMSGLLATRYQDVQCTIVVMNNDGGGIFSYLPQSKIEQHYEQLFGTPTNLGFEQLARMFDLQYDKVSTLEQFKAAVRAPKETSVRLMEVLTNRQENVSAHRALWTRINEELSKWLQSQ